MQPQSEMQLNDQVRQYWEKETCGTGKTVTQDTAAQTLEWYESIEEYRYRLEPFIHAVAQFPRHHGKRMLEIGVGAGTDHLQWARAGLECHGVDLTDAAINTMVSVHNCSGPMRKCYPIRSSILTWCTPGA
jgi:2-polyprenyl-3-methyl-5-hydroxy-6-metoxy-1,4-benzoquinol methylase